jgi:predicted ThiF/HesA family dinucleotide-utilizing enzyme
LLAKLQERLGGNQQVQIITTKPHRADPRFIVITRGGTAIGEYRVTLGKTIEQSGVRKATEKTQEFDPKREKKTFEEARKEFRRD